jgi:hypothetical protein
MGIGVLENFDNSIITESFDVGYRPMRVHIFFEDNKAILSAVKVEFL